MALNWCRNTFKLSANKFGNMFNSILRNTCKYLRRLSYCDVGDRLYGPLHCHLIWSLLVQFGRSLSDSWSSQFDGVGLRLRLGSKRLLVFESISGGYIGSLAKVQVLTSKFDFLLSTALTRARFRAF